jgi:uncharacterized protein
MKPIDPRRLDIETFIARGAVLEGEWPFAGFARLSAGLPVERPPVSWWVRGEHVATAGGATQQWLHLRLRASVVLECQRCLQPFVQPLEVDRRIRFVRGEAEAERLDEESEDDVLALPARLDLHELAEDELILALPLVPRHDACPEPLPQAKADAGAEAPPPHPFAALARLPRDGDGSDG